MTRLRRNRAKRQIDVADLTDQQRNTLLRGTALFGDGFNGDIELLRAAWKRHGRKLLAEFIVDHPGNRPFAWWLFDHKKERPIVNGDDDDEMSIEWERKKTFGFCDTSIGIPKDGELVPWQEEQHKYLRRNDLLTPAELEHDDLQSEAL